MVETIKDYHNWCRLCLDKDKIKLNILKEVGLRKEIQMKVWNCLSLLVEEGDELSKLICYSCFAKLEILHDFKDMCNQSEALVRAYIPHAEEAKWLDPALGVIQGNIPNVMRADVSSPTPFHHQHPGEMEAPYQSVHRAEKIVTFGSPVFRVSSAATDDYDSDDVEIISETVVTSSNSEARAGAERRLSSGYVEDAPCSNSFKTAFSNEKQNRTFSDYEMDSSKHGTPNMKQRSQYVEYPSHGTSINMSSNMMDQNQMYMMDSSHRESNTLTTNVKKQNVCQYAVDTSRSGYATSSVEKQRRILSQYTSQGRRDNEAINEGNKVLRQEHAVQSGSQISSEQNEICAVYLPEMEPVQSEFQPSRSKLTRFSDLQDFVSDVRETESPEMSQPAKLIVRIPSAAAQRETRRRKGLSGPALEEARGKNDRRGT